jgi:hypothetical protein
MDMKNTITHYFALASLMGCVMPVAAAERYFGEPVRLQGTTIYFTSWKYVR